VTRVRRPRPWNDADLPSDPLSRMHCIVELAASRHEAAIEEAERQIERAHAARDLAIAAYSESEEWARLLDGAARALVAIRKSREMLKGEVRRRDGLAESGEGPVHCQTWGEEAGE
jgi:hypothetical protein